MATGIVRRPASLLHAEIYKAVPTARAVIHHHPPFATAYAESGIVRVAT
jgi:ribulose-5-phosphate 4-epimerase/fuculose-1-phosphate aldolase